MYKKLHIDFETRSKIDIKKCGLYKYIYDLSTDIYCLGYAFDDEKPNVWLPGETFPQEIIQHIINKGAVYAFNAEFELLTWNEILVTLYSRFNDCIPELDLDNVYCTAAQGRVNSLPGSLEHQARALGANIGKNTDGKRLISQYSAKNIPWDDIPDEDKNKFIQYCMDDVNVERLVGKALRDLSDDEWCDYRNVVRMNMRGIKVDIDFCKAAIELAEDVKLDVIKKVSLLTNGLVTKPTDRKNRDAFLTPLLTEQQKKLITVNDKLSFSKDKREALYEMEDIHPDVRRYLELMFDAGTSTISKYDAILRSHINGKVYGAFVFSSATTGRASSRLVQLQNMKRPIFTDEEAENLIDHVKRGEPISDPADTLTYLIRPTIFDDTNGMTVMDYSSIEYVVLSWIAGNKKALDDYANGVDAYVELATSIFNCKKDEVTKDQRQAAKITILAAGFGGGKGAVQSMAKAYNVDFTDSEAKNLIDKYRNSHKKEVKLWHDLKKAIHGAVRYPNVEYNVARCNIESDGNNLWIQLPSGRYLRYIDPKYEMVEPPWEGDLIPAVTYKNTKVVPSTIRIDWPRATLNHIVATENICQAIANDLLRDALRQCEKAGLKTFMMVHDELVVTGDHRKTLHDIMTTPPTWAEDLPLKAEGEFRYCYGK